MPFLPPNKQRQSTEGTCCFYNWQNFGWHSALRGPSAVAELLVNLVNSIMGRSIVAYFLTAISLLLIILPSVLRHCWLDVRKSICPVKNWEVRCWRGYLSGARKEGHTHTHTCLTAFFWDYPGELVPERQYQCGFYWSKRQWVAVASAGPYASLHLAPDR